MTQSVEPASVAIFLVRIAVPILLFWLWWRTQHGASERNKYEKDQLIGFRAGLLSLAAGQEEAPEPLQTLRMVGDDYLREKGFQVDPPAVTRQRAGKKARAKAGDITPPAERVSVQGLGDFSPGGLAADVDFLSKNGSRGSACMVPDALASDASIGEVVRRDDSVEGLGSESKAVSPSNPELEPFGHTCSESARDAGAELAPLREAAASDPEGTPKEVGPHVQAKHEAPPDAAANSEEERQAQLEAVLNFAAFRHKRESQRFFLPWKGRRPPPPLLPLSAASQNGGDHTDLDAISTIKSLKANKTACTILKGAMNQDLGLQCKNTARGVHQQLLAEQVSPSEAVLTMMVESSIHEKDLKGASEFLMKLESSGCTPTEELLDKAMKVYFEDKPGGSSSSSKSRS